LLWSSTLFYSLIKHIPNWHYQQRRGPTNKQKKKKRDCYVPKWLWKKRPLSPCLNILQSASGNVSKSTNQHWAKCCTGNRHQRTGKAAHTDTKCSHRYAPTHSAAQCIVSPNAWLPTTVSPRSPRHFPRHKSSTVLFSYLFLKSYCAHDNNEFKKHFHLWLTKKKRDDLLLIFL